MSVSVKDALRVWLEVAITKIVFLMLIPAILLLLGTATGIYIFETYQSSMQMDDTTRTFAVSMVSIAVAISSILLIATVVLLGMRAKSLVDLRQGKLPKSDGTSGGQPTGFWFGKGKRSYGKRR